jgi:uncharacterized protein
VKRLLVVLLAVGGGLLWWRRRSAAESEPAWSESGSSAASSAQDEQPKLGGEVDPELLAILACPLDKQPVQRVGNYLVCQSCQRHYPIREGIPVMLIDEALTPEQAAAEPG